MKKSIKMQKEPKTTINDVLSAVNKLSTDMDQRLNGVEKDLKDVKTRLNTVEVDLKDVKSTINTQLVKKTDLADAFAQFGVINNTKHERVEKLTNLLHKKKILNQTEAQIVLSI